MGCNASFGEGPTISTNMGLDNDGHDLFETIHMLRYFFSSAAGFLLYFSLVALLYDSA